MGWQMVKEIVTHSAMGIRSGWAMPIRWDWLTLLSARTKTVTNPENATPRMKRLLF